MLEQLFGSRTRIKLLKIFLAQPHQHFFVRELTRVIGERINSVRREISNLERLGVIAKGRAEESTQEAKRADRETGEAMSRSRAATSGRGAGRAQGKRRGLPLDKRKFYHANPSFVLFDELKTLVLKSQLLVGRSLTEAVEKLGKVKLLWLTGFFVDDKEAPTDLVVVGALKKEKLARLVRVLEKSFGQSIRYTLMSVHEFKSRKAMTDKFLYGLLEGKKIVLVDTIDQ